jgi:preprotein translocase subunit SecF
VTAVGIVLYLWLRFEWRFGLSAIIANLHDVVIILGCFALLPVGVLAAGAGRGAGGARLLGERVGGGVRPGARELPQDAQGSVPEVIDSAITAVISRTIITHGCTQAMVTTMLLFGGPALHYFALALTIGICFGIYSSVLVASPLVMWLGVDRSQFVRPAKKTGPRDENDGAVV